MKKSRFLLIPLLLGGLMSLSACTLFDDSDIAIKNEYNPPSDEPEIDPDAIYAGGVYSVKSSHTPDALVFKTIGYANEEGKIINTYKVGGANYTEYNVNHGEDYNATKSSNNYDLYVPNSLDKNEKHTVILFIHGGAWVSGFKTDVNKYIYEFTNRGYIAATLKYTLLNRDMNNDSLSIFRNMDEIDACVTSIKSVLGELEFDTTKTNLVIGGASSGAHLAMLYAYSRNSSSALPIKYIIDAVGPVDIKPENWKAFTSVDEDALNTALREDGIASLEADGKLVSLPIAGDKDGYTWSSYQTMRIANGMCGLPYSLEEVEAAADSNKEEIATNNAAAISMTKAGGGEDQLSVTYWMNQSADKIPLIAAYAGLDTIVGIAQYATLEHALTDNGIFDEDNYFYFRNSGHTNIDKVEADSAVYNAFIERIDEVCEAL